MLIHFKKKTAWAKRRQSHLKKYLILFTFSLLGTGITLTQMDPFLKQREEMVKTQIISRGIKDKRVIESMKAVPRHLFVPKDVRKLAYKDFPLNIGYNQTISQPYVVALMTEAAGIMPKGRILEIGTGSGYQTAVLSKLCHEVFSIEIVRPLAENAKKLLQTLGYTNAHVRCGDGWQGWPEQAPFDAIVVTAAPEQVPQPLLVQLKNGGRLVVPVGKFSNQYLKRYTKEGTETIEETLLPVRFVPLTRAYS